MKSPDNIVACAARDLRTWRRGAAKREIAKWGSTIWPSVGDSVDSLRCVRSRKWRKERWFAIHDSRLYL